MAFIFGGVVFVLFTLSALVTFMAAMNQPIPSQDGAASALAIFTVGAVLAALIAGSHFVHFPSW